MVGQWRAAPLGQSARTALCGECSIGAATNIFTQAMFPNPQCWTIKVQDGDAHDKEAAETHVEP
jgi:hypothetical protein